MQVQRGVSTLAVMKGKDNCPVKTEERKNGSNRKRCDETRVPRTSLGARDISHTLQRENINTS